MQKLKFGITTKNSSNHAFKNAESSKSRYLIDLKMITFIIYNYKYLHIHYTVDC